jgi:hypothetical protein
LKRDSIKSFYKVQSKLSRDEAGSLRCFESIFFRKTEAREAKRERNENGYEEQTPTNRRNKREVKNQKNGQSENGRKNDPEKHTKFSQKNRAERKLIQSRKAFADNV